MGREDEAPDTVRSTPSPPVVEPVSAVTVVKRRGRPRGPSTARHDQILAEIERLEGRVEPHQVMYVLRAYRALEATNRAQKEVLAKQVEELKRLKKR